MEMLNFMLWLLYPFKKKYPLNKRLGELYSQAGYCGDKRNLLLLLGFKPLIIHPIT